MNTEPRTSQQRALVIVSDLVFLTVLIAMWITGAGLIQLVAAAGCGVAVHYFLKPGTVTIGRPEWFESTDSTKEPDQ